MTQTPTPDSALSRGTIPHLPAELPAWNDEKCWHDLAMERARAEGIPLLNAADLVLAVRSTTPDLAEVQAILDRHGITRDAIEAQIDAEQAAIDEGTLVPLSSVRRAHTSVRDPN